MKRLAVYTIAIAVVLMLAAPAFAQQENQNSSAKATASFADVHLLAGSSYPVNDPLADSVGWTTILGNRIKTANDKDLFIDASIECGIYSDTLVRSKDGITDTSLASGGVRIRVVVDPAPNSGSPPSASGFYASPAGGHDVQLVDTNNDGVLDDASFFNVGAGQGVSYCKRIQLLSAKLQGILSEGCFDGDDTTACTTTPAEIRLALATLDANSFNFIAENLSSGNHLVEVQAKLDTSALGQQGESKAKAFVGMGSVTIEEVRMVRGEDISF